MLVADFSQSLVLRHRVHGGARSAHLDKHATCMAVGVHVDKDDLVDVGAGDQSICSGRGTCPWTSLDGNTLGSY